MDTNTSNIIIAVAVVVLIGGYFAYKQAKWKKSSFVGVVSDIVPKTAWRKKPGLTIGPIDSEKVVVGYKYYFKSDDGKTFKLVIGNPSPQQGDVVASLILSATGMPADQVEFLKLKIGDRVQKKSGEQFPAKI